MNEITIVPAISFCARITVVVAQMRNIVLVKIKHVKPIAAKWWIINDPSGQCECKSFPESVQIKMRVDF